MDNAVPRINLLPLDDVEKAPFGKFLKWALTYGRYIVVLTELVVLAAFLSRFKLDRDMNDLSVEVERKKRIVQSAEAFEGKVRILQSRLNQVAVITKSEEKPDEIITLFTSLLPLEVRLYDFSILNKRITVGGITASEAGIATLTDSLRKEKKVKSVSVDKLEKNLDIGGLSFVLSVELWP